eukprot:6273336-Amphidinium_carterae.1
MKRTCMSVSNFLTQYKEEIAVLGLAHECELLTTCTEKLETMKEQVIRVCKASRLGEALFRHVKNTVTHMEFSINVDKIVKALVAKDVTSERYAEAKAGASTRDNYLRRLNIVKSGLLVALKTNLHATRSVLIVHHLERIKENLVDAT